MSNKIPFQVIGKKEIKTFRDGDAIFTEGGTGSRITKVETELPDKFIVWAEFIDYETGYSDTERKLVILKKSTKTKSWWQLFYGPKIVRIERPEGNEWKALVETDRFYVAF